MPYVSRRDVLSSGLALTASSVLARSAWAREAGAFAHSAPSGSATPLPAVGPREQLLFDFGWKFTFGHGTDPSRDLNFGFGQGDFAKTGDFNFAKAGFDDSKWRTLNLPHDWGVELPFIHDDAKVGDDIPLQSHGYKPLGRRYPETSVGWYRREFEIPTSDISRRITVEFDGVFRSVLVFVNGCFVGRSDNGYAPFRFDLSDFLNYGAKNYIVVRVDASFGDGWFYEGAGIYRHVWLIKTDALHLGRWESYVRAELKGNSAKLALGTVVINQGKVAEPAEVEWQLFDPKGKPLPGSNSSASRSAPLQPDESAEFTAEMEIPDPALWSVDEPNLYSAVLTVKSGGKVRDAERVTFGVRSAVFDPDKGFFLNGKSIKIQGTCNHQDHAGVGAALPDRLQCFRLAVLRQMGGNAVRTSHNMPTPEWVEACDRMGMMMMCETRQMSSSPEGLAQLETMVKRYRNSPSIILWSIGNEEFLLQDTMAEQGARIAATMVRRCHELDPTRAVSAAVNADNEKGVSDALDVIGFNYHLEFPDGYHRKHPTKAVYGSETSSAIATRGMYSNDPLRNLMNNYNGVVPWGESAEEWWTFYGTRDWLAGGFAWTGFDYRGEPTPYGWPSINSQFGIVDMCGFPKDMFYYYKAWWGREPSLHVFPHWNFEGREGDEIPVWVYTNLEEVELFANGKSLGSQKVPHLGHVEWKVKYEPGFIEARGSRGGQAVLTEKRETTGPAVSIRLTADRTEISADGEDIAVLKVEGLDTQGRLVPTAANLIAFKIAGEGLLLGVGNGDPNCQESDKEPKRSLFNGLAQVIVQSSKRPGVTGALDKAGKRLTLDRVGVASDGSKQQITLFPNSNFVRYSLWVTEKEPGAPQYKRTIEVGVKKEGETFAAGGSEVDLPKCIVTGGAATLTVSYQGKTFPLCCTGCKAEFDENPEKYVKKAALRAEAASKAPAKPASSVGKDDGAFDGLGDEPKAKLKDQGKATVASEKPKPVVERGPQKVDRPKPDPSARAASLLKLGQNLEKSGKTAAALGYYRQVVKDFAKTPAAKTAAERVKALGPE